MKFKFKSIPAGCCFAYPPSNDIYVKLNRKITYRTAGATYNAVRLGFGKGDLCYIPLEAEVQVLANIKIEYELVSDWEEGGHGI